MVALLSEVFDFNHDLPEFGYPVVFCPLIQRSNVFSRERMLEQSKNLDC